MSNLGSVLKGLPIVLASQTSLAAVNDYDTLGENNWKEIFQQAIECILNENTGTTVKLFGPVDENADFRSLSFHNNGRRYVTSIEVSTEYKSEIGDTLHISEMDDVINKSDVKTYIDGNSIGNNSTHGRKIDGVPDQISYSDYLNSQRYTYNTELDTSGTGLKSVYISDQVSYNIAIMGIVSACENNK